MLPNVRLMIAATIASVVVLICGFGVFAAFRVSHDPLVRLPPAAAPLRLLADDAAVRPMAFAAGEPFDRRFEIGELQRVAETMNSPTRTIDRRDNADGTVAPRAAATGRRTEEMEKTAAVEASAEPTAAAAAMPAEEVKSAPAAANDYGPAATAAEHASAAVNTLDAAAPPATAAVGALAPPTDQAPAPEQTKLESEAGPASVATAAAEAPPAVDEAATKKTKRAHAARAHRARRLIAGTGAQFSNQDSSFAQPGYQTTQQAWPPQSVQQRPRAKPRHSTIAARTTKEPSAATGGPFVSPPSR